MKTTAMVLNEYGESAKFIKSEINLDALKGDQVLIEVKATSINPVDNKILRGAASIGPDLPSPIHGDVSGVVIEIGKNVTTFKPGDQVLGIAGGLVGYSGATANHMIVNEHLIYHKPKTLSFAESASLPLVFVTAYEGLVEKGNIFDVNKSQHRNYVPNFIYLDLVLPDRKKDTSDKHLINFPDN